MLKELVKGIYGAIGREDIPLMASDMLEPKSRPGMKIYLKPKSYMVNSNVRFTDIDIMILYYARDAYSYYLEHYELEEALEELITGSIELENGAFVELDEIEFKNDNDILVAYTACRIDTYIDTEQDDEFMEEMQVFMRKGKEEA